MSWILYKLKFKTAVHFGADRAGGAGLATSSESCHADTLFSALCHEWLNLFGEESLKELIMASKEGVFLISDLLPWKGEELYLPRPLLYVSRNQRKQKEEEDLADDDRKKWKKIKFLPVSKFDAYLQSLLSGAKISLGEELEIPEVLSTRVAVGRGEESNPYLVAARIFPADGGLYFVTQIGSDDLIDKLEAVIESLSLSGLGGKRKSGLGRFELAEDPIEFDEQEGFYASDALLGKMLSRESELYMSLCPLSPTKEDLEKIKQEDSFYNLLPRRGFVQSKTYSSRPLKHRDAIMFGTGSCLNYPAKGQILDLAQNGGHPVYRYGLGFYVGVNLC